MRVLALALLVFLLAAPADAVPADDKAKADAEFLNRVNAAIDSGLLWLVKQQREDGTWPGYEGQYPMGMTALCYLTVLKCDYPRKSDVVKKAKKVLKERFEKQHPSRLKTYSVAVLMMALEAEHAPLRTKKKAKKSRYANVPGGGRVKLPPGDFEWMTKCAKWMVASQTETVWRYPGGGTDLSNTQYALLGLASARRCGVPVDRDVFLKTARHLISRQEKKGPKVRRIVHMDAGPGYANRYASNIYDHARGWSYVPERSATGSMTTAGVSSMAICRSELLGWAGYKGEFEQKVERSIHDGLAWLNHHFTVKRNPPGGQGWHYYYLFGLERAGVLTNRKFIGDHDWYREGADYLVDRQTDDGCWNRGRGPRGQETMYSNTCFALLFLRRATVPVRVPKAVTPTGPTPVKGE